MCGSVAASALALTGARRNVLPSGLHPLQLASISRQSTAARALPQTGGTLTLRGLLRDNVRVVRDRWGVPHIYAKNQDDLFAAQGFVQAQDRLFQIDLWHRSTQGRLAEILGPSYVERDRLTRLMRYRGDMAAEWGSYAPDARQIATQFVKGVNAWVEIARRDLPVEFQLAGYEPDLWEPEDLLSRAEAFSMSGNASAEVFRTRATAAYGLELATRLLPPDPAVSVSVPSGVEVSLLGTDVADTLDRIGAPPRFPTIEAPRPGDVPRRVGSLNEVDGSNNWVVSGARSATGQPFLANDPHRALDHPSLRYLVHLNAPGWNVIGAVVPWFPGVAIGHNDRVAWGLTIFSIDAQDLYIERLNPANPHQYEIEGVWRDFEVVKDRVPVKGTPRGVDVEHQYTRHGPVVYTDARKQMAIALRWTGAEPGTAGYLAGISLSRARSWNEFRDALRRWKMPGENFVYADIDGNIGYQAAGLAPIRANWHGLYPVPGWSGAFEWNGWYGLQDLPNEANPARGFIATANHNTLPPRYTPVINYSWAGPARIGRILEVLGASKALLREDSERLQHDATAWNARRLVPLLEPLSSANPDAERARRLLTGWDCVLSKNAVPGTLYVYWERALRQQLVAPLTGGRPGPDMSDHASAVLVEVLTNPPAVWFPVGSPVQARDALLLRALEAAVGELRKDLRDDMARWTWDRLHTATFVHPLATDASRRALLNVGPFARDGYGSTVFATGGRFPLQTSGASFREILDLSDWDRSEATSAAGQSGHPGSPHFADLANLWAEQRYFPLSFSDSAVRANAESTLVLKRQ